MILLKCLFIENFKFILLTLKVLLCFGLVFLRGGIPVCIFLRDAIQLQLHFLQISASSCVNNTLIGLSYKIRLKLFANNTTLTNVNTTLTGKS